MPYSSNCVKKLIIKKKKKNSTLEYFFFEKPPKKGEAAHSGRSEKYTWVKSGGTSSIQTCKVEKLQAIRAKP